MYITEKIEDYLGSDRKFNEYFQNLIEKDCKHYLSLTKNGDMEFFRGMYGKTDSGKKKVRQDREAKGMDGSGSYNFNKWLVKNGHTDRSKSVMATSMIERGRFFSEDVYVIYPIGKFNYTWINKRDVNMRDRWSNDEQDAFDSITIGFADSLPSKTSNDIVKKMFKTNKGIRTAYMKGFEIWFDCKEYYYKKVV